MLKFCWFITSLVLTRNYWRNANNEHNISSFESNIKRWINNYVGDCAQLLIIFCKIYNIYNLMKLQTNKSFDLEWISPENSCGHLSFKTQDCDDRIEQIQSSSKENLTVVFIGYAQFLHLTVYQIGDTHFVDLSGPFHIIFSNFQFHLNDSCNYSNSSKICWRIKRIWLLFLNKYQFMMNVISLE